MTQSHEFSADDARVRRLLDRADISDVQLRYATGTDSRDWKLFRSCFTDEVEVDFSDGFGQPVVRVTADEWVQATAPRMESFTATQHMITNHASGWRIARVKLTALWMTGNFGIFQTALTHEDAPAASG
ncbi:MAG: nuclear transport factor 2 family protein [Pseudonocardia sp.]|nr:nuclear transport factor 2 family protein [Pseudonocardia sp.]